jgi:hypothetical protein
VAIAASARSSDGQAGYQTHVHRFVDKIFALTSLQLGDLPASAGLPIGWLSPEGAK